MEFIRQKQIIALILVSVLVTSCGNQVKKDIPQIFALRRDGITYELIEISPPYYNDESIAHYSVSSYDIAHNSEMIVYSTFLYGNESIVLVPENSISEIIGVTTSFLRNPNISPSDNFIVFEKRENIESDPHIVVSDVDFEEITDIISNISAILPMWSPDGEQISLLTPIIGDCPIDDLYYCRDLSIYSLDSQEITNIINGPINRDYSVKWNQVQNKVLYSKWSKGKYHLFTFDLGNTLEEQITDSEFDDIMGVWSMDGKAIAFSRIQKTNNQLCILRTEEINCLDQKNNIVTGITWISDTDVLCGIYNIQTDKTNILIWSVNTQDEFQIASYSGYIEDFKTYSDN